MKESNTGSGRRMSGALGRLASVVLLALNACLSGPSTAPIYAVGYRVRGPTPEGWIQIEEGEGAIRFMMPGIPDVRRQLSSREAASLTTFVLRAEANSRGYYVHVFDTGARSRHAPGIRGIDAMQGWVLRQFGGDIERATDGLDLGILRHPLKLLRRSRGKFRVER